MYIRRMLAQFTFRTASPTATARIHAGRHGPDGHLVSQSVGRCTTIGIGGVTVRRVPIGEVTGTRVTGRIITRMAVSRLGDLTVGPARLVTSIIRMDLGPV